MVRINSASIQIMASLFFITIVAASYYRGTTKTMENLV